MQQYSLSELCFAIEQSLALTMNDTYWVRAEIISLSTRSGHCYMELVEKANNDLLSAKVRATCWSNTWDMLSAYFMHEAGCALKSGMKVLLQVEVSFHSVYGLSLNVVGIDPRFSIGEIVKQRDLVIKRLQDEGVAQMNKSLTLPTLIKRIAVVSSDSAAGYEDFCTQLQESGFCFSTTLYTAIMQGDNAERSIIRALEQIANTEEDFDAVVIIRGGGATTDLTCFDSYELCSHVAQFPLPIISGIGHTKDISVLDLMAHTSLKTPTAVAAFLIDRMAVQQEYLQRLFNRLQQTAQRQILIRRHRLELLNQRLEARSPERIYKMGYSLLMINGKVVRSVQDVESNSILTTHLIDGAIQSKTI